MGHLNQIGPNTPIRIRNNGVIASQPTRWYIIAVHAPSPSRVPGPRLPRLFAGIISFIHSRTPPALFAPCQDMGRHGWEFGLAFVFCSEAGLFAGRRFLAVEN